MKDLTKEELDQLKDGSIVTMGCPSCEGGEKHIKQNGQWICTWCGAKQ